MNIDQFLEGPLNSSWTATSLAQVNSTVFPIYNSNLQKATLDQLCESRFTLLQLVDFSQQHEPLFLKPVIALIKLSAGASIEQAYASGGQ